MTDIFEELVEFFYDEGNIRVEELNDCIELLITFPEEDSYSNLMYQLELFFKEVPYNIEDYTIEGDYDSIVYIEKG